ncbi:uncharacterized protein LOC131224221 [Magnolia sinica]|uniref:uncharacterized protein LOC131224221 n=1 Tax=Magnolia sinica TaxID=86752 RepID=UPI0026585016|nr:uncharacterized protein LOC131224221 [Magnolia sinica]
MGECVGFGQAGPTEEWQEVRRRNQHPDCRLFIGNLPFSASSEDIKARFGQFGALADVFITTFSISGRSKGFSFVTFKLWDEAKAAMELQNGRFLGRCRMTVSIANQRPSNRSRLGNGGSKNLKQNA